MKTVHAIYKGGVFRPIEPVDLPDDVHVEFEARVVEPDVADRTDREARGLDGIYAIMSRRYDTGQTDAAARHNEHQP